jgi:hypothetical protein
MPKSLYAAIPIVMNRFDFAKVHKVMAFLDWKWVTPDGYATPTQFQLEHEAYRQLNQCVAEFEKRGCPASGMNVSSGGFQALVMTFEKGDPQLQLVFYVDESAHTGR